MADEYLRRHDPAKNGSTRDVAPSYRSERDDLRNRTRQQKLERQLLRHHLEATEVNRSPSTEQVLIKTNEQNEYRKAIVYLFSLFPAPCHGRLLLIAVIKGVDWQNSKQLSQSTGLSGKEVAAAKAKIRYRVKTRGSPALNDFIRVSSKSDRERGVQ
ncbi:hypothetical protein ACOXXX_18065 [Thalassococcus sp. BH17M4-6]|uniref:hypothetical protein n=1 Tax=Thalassococcus sp. BH17M4-6 TaxID=3413148 RepID=UPI003BD10BF4